MSIGGVTLVSFYSNSNNDCQDPTQTNNHTHSGNDSYTLDHMVSHLNPKGGTCSSEESTPLGYVVRSFLLLLDSLLLFLSLLPLPHTL